MYIPGRIRTASKPSKTWIWLASYSFANSDKFFVSSVIISLSPLGTWSHQLITYQSQQLDLPSYQSHDLQLPVLL